MATDKTFDFKRYSAPTDAHENHSLEDGSDALANRGFAISFQHLPSGKSVYFKAFITQFNEAYAPDWAAETVYGRADPIYFFKNTTRSISLGFKIPAASEGEAYENLARVQKLVQFLYPAYVDVQNANTISQSPLVRLKVMNLLEKSTVGLASRGPTEIQTYGEYRSTNDPSKGLLGVISSVAINHNLEDDASGVFEKAENTILPRLIDITMEFKPIHEHTVGWDESGEFADNTSFPYGAPSILAAAESEDPFGDLAAEEAKLELAALAEPAWTTRPHESERGVYDMTEEELARHLGEIQPETHEEALLNNGQSVQTILASSGRQGQMIEAERRSDPRYGTWWKSPFDSY